MLAGSRFLRAFAVAACVALSAATPASAAGWLEKSIYLIGPRYDGVLPDLPRRKAGSGIRTCRSSASTVSGKSPTAHGLLRRYRAATARLSRL
jgi:hypothetical protein